MIDKATIYTDTYVLNLSFSEEWSIFVSPRSIWPVSHHWYMITKTSYETEKHALIHLIRNLYVTIKVFPISTMPKNKRSTSWDRLSLFASTYSSRQKYTLTQYLSLSFPYWLTSWLLLLTLVLLRIYCNRNSQRYHSPWKARTYRSAAKRKDMHSTRKNELVESVTSVSPIQGLLTIELIRFFSDLSCLLLFTYDSSDPGLVQTWRYPSPAPSFVKLFAVIIFVVVYHEFLCLRHDNLAFLKLLRVWSNPIHLPDHSCPSEHPFTSSVFAKYIYFSILFVTDILWSFQNGIYWTSLFPNILHLSNYCFLCVSALLPFLLTYFLSSE